MARISALDRQVVKVLDANGTLLTAATVGPLDEDGTLALDDVDDHGALIDYYFGRCERIVIVEDGGTALEGTLDTQWLSSERGWWVALSQSVAARALAPVATPEPALTPVPVATYDEPVPLEPAPTEVRVPATLVR